MVKNGQKVADGLAHSEEQFDLFFTVYSRTSVPINYGIVHVVQ